MYEQVYSEMHCCCNESCYATVIKWKLWNHHQQSPRTNISLLNIIITNLVCIVGIIMVIKDKLGTKKKIKLVDLV